MKTTLFTTGPYMNMLFDGMYVPKEQDDGSFVWANPASMSSDTANRFNSKFCNLTYFRIGDGKIPLIALKDVGVYNLWIFDNPHESAGLDLEVATDQVSMIDIANTFTKVTGTKGVHKKL